MAFLGSGRGPLSPEYPRIRVIAAISDWVCPDQDALPDTGFTGGVLVPYRYVDDIPVAPDSGRLRLGNGLTVQALWWDGEISIGDFNAAVTIWALGDDFLIGREVLDQMEICFEFGERVRMQFRE